jgi:hypothetical protein
MGISLTHPVQVEARLDGETSAFELARCLAIKRLAARDWSALGGSFVGAWVGCVLFLTCR